MTVYIIHPCPEGADAAREVKMAIMALDQKKLWSVEIKRYTATRSDEQNRALFGVAYKILSDATGNDTDDLHTYFCGEYFGWVERAVMGQRRRVPKRTTTKGEDGKRSVMGTADFAEFFTFIQDRAAQTVGIVIPDPDKNWREST